MVVGLVDARGEEVMTYPVTIAKEQMKKFRDEAQKELELELIRMNSAGDPDQEIINTFVKGCIFGFIEAQNAIGDAILKDLEL